MFSLWTETSPMADLNGGLQSLPRMKEATASWVMRMFRSTSRTSTTTRPSSPRGSTTETSQRTAPPVSQSLAAQSCKSFKAMRGDIPVTPFATIFAGVSGLFLWSFESTHHHQTPFPMSFPQRGHLCLESKQSCMSMQHGRHSKLEWC